jgi:hypothetical protein
MALNPRHLLMTTSSSGIRAVLVSICGFLLLLAPVKLFPANFSDDSLRIDILMSSKMLENIPLSSEFLPELEVTPDQLIILATKNQFYQLGWGQIHPVCKRTSGTIRSYAYTYDKLLLVVQDEKLCSMDPSENLSPFISLPRAGMAVTAGKHVMYLFDRSEHSKSHALFILAEGGRYKKLVDAPAAIQSVTEMNNRVLFACENALFRFSPKTNEVQLLAAVQKNRVIRSLAADTVNNRIYFATDGELYTLMDTTVLLITDRIGGTLQVVDSGLIVFSPKDKLLIRISGLEQGIAGTKEPVQAVKQPAQDVITNATVVDLMNARLADDLIIKLINSSEVNFDLGVDATIDLANQGVSSAVIMAMRNAMKRKHTNKQQEH